MSRSFKKAFTTISKRLRLHAHSAIRHKVKAILHTTDVEDIDGLTLLDIEADTREMGQEDYGTKMGLEYENLKKLSSECIDWEELKRKERRK